MIDGLGDVEARGMATAARGSPAVLLSSIGLVAGKVATMGFGFVAWIVAARLNPPADVGLASAGVSAVTLCAQVALVGVGSAVITIGPRYRDAPGRLLDTSISLVALSSFVAGLLFLTLAATVLRELRVIASDVSYASLFLLLAVGGTLGVLFDQASTARRRGDQVFVRGVAGGISTLAVLVVIGPLIGGGSRGIFAAWVVGAGVVTAVLGLWTMTRAIPGYRPALRLAPTIAAELVRVGFPNYLLTLSERAPGFVLPIIVTELLSPAQNAAWYAAWMMAWVVFIVPIQVGMTSFAEIATEPSESRRIVRNGVATSLGLGAAGALTLALLADPVLRLLGPSYAEAGVGPLRILLLGVLPMTVIQAYFSLSRARHALRGALVIGAVASLASILVPAVAGTIGGLVPMAISWLVVQIGVAVVAGVRLRRAVDLGPAAA